MALTGSTSRNPAAAKTYTINDFTPGIQQWGGPGVAGAWPLDAPPGSAAYAYRCWAKPNVGLIPFCTYRPVQTYSVTDATHQVCVSLGSMVGLAGRGGAIADVVSTFLVQHGPGNTPTDFHITRCAPISPGNNTPTTVYSSSASVFPGNTTSWPMMDIGVWEDPINSGTFSRTAITTDPISTSLATNTSGNGTWVTVRSWQNPTGLPPDTATGTFPLVGATGSYPRILYHDLRMVIFQQDASITAGGFSATDGDVMFISDLKAPTNIQNAGVFAPEMGTAYGAWGSWSTGELALVYSEGGAVLLYGDLSLPQSFKLTGPVGTAGAIGKAAASPTGMIYVRGDAGAYLWNGDNTVTNISRQLPDVSFVRSAPGGGFAVSPALYTSHTVWGEWVFFPNNWMFDTATQSWWRTEDPNVINFQVNDVNLAAPGFVIANAGQPAALTTYQWVKGSDVNSWYWLSNPIPVTIGDLVTLTSVEILATNMEATDATIVVQPLSSASPLGTATPIAQQNNNMVTFTVPARTSGFRVRQRLGYADYNVQLAITAANTLPPAGAPVLHTISCDYTETRTSGVVA